MTNVEVLKAEEVLAKGTAKLKGIDVVSVTRDGETTQKVVLEIDSMSDTIFMTLPEMLKSFGVMAKGVLTDSHLQLLAFFDVDVSWQKSRVCRVGTTYSPWIQDDMSEDFSPEESDFIDLHGISIKFTTPNAMLLSMLKDANSVTDGILYDRAAEKDARTEKRAALKRVTADDVVDVIGEDAIATETGAE